MLGASFEEEAIMSGDMFMNLVERKQDSLLMVDPTFVVELAWVAYVAGAGGVKEFQCNVLQCFPSEGKHCTLEGFSFSRFLLS